MGPWGASESPWQLENLQGWGGDKTCDAASVSCCLSIRWRVGWGRAQAVTHLPPIAPKANSDPTRVGAPHSRSFRALMKNQEFSGSSELSDGHDATSKALQTPKVHDEPAEPAEPEKPEVSEEAYKQGQRGQLNISEPDELYEPFEPSEFQAPHVSHAPQEPEDLYEPCESYEPYEPQESQKCHEPYESYEPYEYYKPYEPHAPDEPQERHAPCEPQERHAPRKPHKPRKASTSRKPQGSKAPREPYKAHEAELLPRTTMMMAPSLVTKFRPRIPPSTLSGRCWGPSKALSNPTPPKTGGPNVKVCMLALF